MQPIQLITRAGQLVALIADDQAIIPANLPDAERRHVHAMCLYALQIRAGERPGPYNAEDAERYARAAHRCDRRRHV